MAIIKTILFFSCAIFSQVREEKHGDTRYLIKTTEGCADLCPTPTAGNPYPVILEVEKKRKKKNRENGSSQEDAN
ncbi:MAG: hypothetical protein NZT61_04400 [Deltaproteobacteria bacterium]|nr:hypothetical protein [Deltaproteobacteria bacterium]MCX7952590.1 hypothetical protein [Deltaproteobacteria bacterium]